MSKHGQTLEKLRDHTDEDLLAAVATTRDELFRMQLGQYTNQVTSTAALTTKRRDVARILTILKGRQLGTETQAQKAAAQSTAKAATKAKRAATKTPKATKAKS